MKSIVLLRGRRLVVVAAALFAVLGGIAYASIPDAGGVYHACVMKNGQLRIIDPSSDQCRASNESEITFNQQGQKGDPGSPGAPGQPGQPGVSPTVAQLAVGDSHCPAGGAAITDATGSTAYVCSGQNGADGNPFSGTFTSPNGKYSIKVTDTGVTAVGADTTLALTDTGMRVDAHGSSSITLMSSNSLTLRSGNSVLLQGGGDVIVKGGSSTTVSAGGTVSVTSGGATTVSGGLLSLTGGFLTINPGSMCFPAARVSDPIAATSANQGASSTGVIVNGSSTVCIGG
jgi:hypothetical protein